MVYDTRTHWAFNAGCDARIKGYALRHNPFPEADIYHHEWRRGYFHVGGHWGKDAKWPITPLPEAAK